MSTEPKPFRALSIKELRALPSEKRADYLGQLAVHNLLERATLEQPATQSPGSEQFDERKARLRNAIASIAAFVVACVAIYIAYIYLRRPLGDGLASGVSLLAVLVVARLLIDVRDRYASQKRRRYLRQESPPGEA